jgi:hypothetical protein
MSQLIVIRMCKTYSFTGGLACMAGSQSMSFDSIGAIAGDRRADTLQLLRGSCFIHQCARIFAQDPIAVPEHMQGHEHCDACVQHRDPGQHGEDDADEDTKRGDHIGQHVLAIRNKGGRPLQTSRYPDRDDGRDRRRHVDDAFQGIGIESQAAGNEIGGELDGQHHKADRQAAERNFQRFIHCKILAAGAVRRSDAPAK